MMPESRMPDLVEWLSKQVPDLPVFAVVPPERPKRFATIERTGGSTGMFIDNALFAVQVWARSILEADKLASQLRYACWDLAVLPWVASVNLGNLANFTDTASKHYRYQFTLELGIMVNI